MLFGNLNSQYLSNSSKILHIKFHYESLILYIKVTISLLKKFLSEYEKMKLILLLKGVIKLCLYPVQL